MHRLSLEPKMKRTPHPSQVDFSAPFLEAGLLLKIVRKILSPDVSGGGRELGHPAVVTLNAHFIAGTIVLGFGLDLGRGVKFVRGVGRVLELLLLGELGRFLSFLDLFLLVHLGGWLELLLVDGTESGFREGGSEEDNGCELGEHL